MDIEALRTYCLNKPGVTEDMPFGDTVLALRLKGKIFLLVPLDTIGLQMNLKCDPEKAQELRATYSAVVPGYHMNKTHWNTVYVDGSFSDAELIEWIDHSYELIKKSLPKPLQKELSENI
jgi:predicted DNA-binding protein (MmcQ/YjbR family)